MAEPRIYRASSLGYSLEQLVAPHLGFEPLPTPQWLQKAFDDGQELEEVVIAKLRDKGWEITDQQLEVNLEVIPGQAVIQGHLDGIVNNGGVREVLEIKTMSHRSFTDWCEHGWDSNSALTEKYKWQASAYMLATGLPHTMVCYDKETGDWDSRYTREPFYLISDLANKVLAAEQHINAGTIPEGCKDYPCPYVYLHGEKEEPEPADNDLDHMLEAWLQYDREIKKLEVEKAALRKVIVERTGEIAGKVRGSNGVMVTTYWQKESEYTVKRKGAWVTKIEGAKNASH